MVFLNRGSINKDVITYIYDPGQSDSTSWMTFWDTSAALEMQKLSLLYRRKPKCVENFVMYLDLVCSVMGWYPNLRSILENHPTEFTDNVDYGGRLVSLFFNSHIGEMHVHTYYHLSQLFGLPGDDYG